MNRLAKELVRIARSLEAETSAETIDRLISKSKEMDSFDVASDELDSNEFNKVWKDIRDELRKTPTDVLQELFNEISKRPNIGGWGSGFHTGEVYKDIKDELDRRDAYTKWNNRNTTGEKKTGEKEIELDGGIKAVLIKDGDEYEKEKWSVRTPQRGLRMSKGKTPKEAISNANAIINRIGIDKVKEMIADQDK